jgi:hypothetical protein
MENFYPLFKIAELIAKEKCGSLSESESSILHHWLAENDNNKVFYNKLQNGEKLIKDLEDLKKFDAPKAFQKVERKISKERVLSNTLRFIPNYMKYAAAIAIFAVCTYFIIHQFNGPKTSYYTQSTILPGKQKAILITANNREIMLESSSKKQIIDDGLATVIQSGSTLSYSTNDSANKSKAVITYNTLIIPRGAEYTLILSDGTEVMLNSDSKLKYPVVFNRNIREVELEGEAFFKVKKSQKQPFIVKADALNVKVYGTVFNVSAYSNEGLAQTTLIEGSVGVSINNSKAPSELKITPGQQYTYDKGNGSIQTKEVNTERYIAWTKGMFVFENEPIENILKVMSRWYNFDYEFKDENLKRQRFTLSLGRYDKVSKIFDMISISSNVKFSAKGNSITVYSE